MKATTPIILCLGVALLCWGCSDPDTEVPEEVDVTMDVEQNPNMTIGAIASISLSYPVSVEIELSSAETPLQVTSRAAASSHHRLPVVGMRPESEYTLRAVAYHDGEELGRSDAVTFTTGELPDVIPEFEVQIHEPELMQPGITLFAAPPFPPMDERTLCYVGVDEEGFVVWYYCVEVESIEVNPDIYQLTNGNLLVWTYSGFQFINMAGEVVAEFFGDHLGGGGFHHDAQFLENGNFITMIGEQTEVPHPETGEMIPLQGDRVVEVSPNGRIVWEWSSFDHLDIHRLPDRLSNEPHPLNHYYHLTHTNAVVPLEDENAVLLSIRNQHWVIKIDRETGDIIWRMGNDGDFVLTNYDEASWQTWFNGQHAPELIGDDLMLIYDNGSVRYPRPDAPFSRAVLYRIDQEALEAEFLWSFETDHFTDFIGDVDLQPNDNVLVCAGGIDVFAPVVYNATIYEVTRDPEPVRVWDLTVEPFHLVYRAERIQSFYVQESQ